MEKQVFRHQAGKIQLPTQGDELFPAIRAAIVLALVATCWANTPGKNSVALTWNETTSGATFNVYRGSATGVCTGVVTPYVTGVATTNFTDSAVTAGQTYFYAVSAVKGVESACSSEVQITMPSPPAVPSNLQGTTN